MSRFDVPGGHIMLLTAATAFRRRIRVYTVFKAKYPVINFNPVGGFQPKLRDLHLLEFSKSHFTNHFFMSIMKDPWGRTTELSTFGSVLKNQKSADFTEILKFVGF